MRKPEKKRPLTVERAVKVNETIAGFHADLTAWRRDIHAHPETAFEEHRTADFVAGKLAEFGVGVHRGLAGTGVVGTLERGTGPTIGLRADLDALDITEDNTFPHRSQNEGKMHACGHDGHTSMLLGAARYLAEADTFSGTVHFIFQPAEELAGGGKRMIEEGLLRLFPVDTVYGMHNRPGLPVGHFHSGTGAMMAASDTFEIKVRGVGTHAGWPHLGEDAVVAAAAIVTSLQSIISRDIDPLAAAVVSVTQIHGGSAWNVLPEEVVLRGTTRSLTAAVRDNLESMIRRMVENTALAHGVTADCDYRRGYPVLVNHEAETILALGTASGLVGADQVERRGAPSMGCEDFAYMLEERPGSFIWIGNGPAQRGGGLHGPRYDFNDEILPLGASYWAKLVENTLPA